MVAKFSNFKNQVSLLLEANTSISIISTILNKPKRSIFNAIYRIKRKNKEFNLERVSKGRIKKLSLRDKRINIQHLFVNDNCNAERRTCILYILIYVSFYLVI